MTTHEPTDLMDLPDAGLADDEGAAELLEAELRNRVRIEPLALEEEFIRTPSDILRLTKLHADAIEEHLRAKAKAKKLRGLLVLRAWAAAREAGAKSTVGEIDAAVEQMPEWEEAQNAEITAEALRERLKGAVAAVLCKRDMVIQMGANVRAEMERDPVVRERAKADRDGGWR